MTHEGPPSNSGEQYDLVEVRDIFIALWESNKKAAIEAVLGREVDQSEIDSDVGGIAVVLAEKAAEDAYEMALVVKVNEEMTF